MQLRIVTKVRSKRPGVRHLTGSVYEVAVSTSPVNGAANTAVIEELAKYFNLKKNQVKIIAGFTSVNKTIELTQP